MFINKAKGAFIRSKAKWLEKGEQNSSYFFKLEKQRQTKNSINKLHPLMVLLLMSQRTNICEKYYKHLCKSTFLQDHESFFSEI